MTDLLTPQMTIIALAILAALSVGGLIYAMFFTRLRGASVAEQRLDHVAKSRSNTAPIARSQDAAAKRRRAVQELLRDMEVKERARARSRTNPPLELRLQQAGLSWSKSTFFLMGIVLGALLFIGALVFVHTSIYVALGLAIGGAAGFPFWFVNFLRKRRMKAFLHHFPNAVDIIVRGVKAGLPLNDCLRMVASESTEPVRGEFRFLHERQSMGMTVAEAISELPNRVPLPEANFFSLAITIQQQAGGNLSEALSNLSKVLRERAKMAGKVKAYSTEAKVSAYIIGALPVIVTLLVYLTSPDYITSLFTERLGNIILIASGIWMAIGIFVMRRMINFDF